jgi:hypothetical protein
MPQFSGCSGPLARRSPRRLAEQPISPFEQGDSSIHPRYGGLGLGLSIARTLMKAHGGTLEAESEGSGQGAKFTARFKIDESYSELTAQDPLQRKSSPPPAAKTSVAASLNSANGQS